MPFYFHFTIKDFKPFAFVIFKTVNITLGNILIEKCDCHEGRWLLASLLVQKSRLAGNLESGPSRFTFLKGLFSRNLLLQRLCSTYFYVETFKRRATKTVDPIYV